ncbi:LysE family translocator [Natronospirillum operosum]|uniref:LysE family translocator n=1 Tax=Natronospirillum operosum TaxID=2759953 RepID=A0A4Z0W8F8_9GAMM|nr:LysE family translocator [Natronospirillum operosum]TGG93229.1 LysE family translocator [Natronospirillum operosum]
MTLSYLLSLFMFTVVATITPGPNNLMVTASGANFGFRRTIPHILGIAVGFSVLGLVIASGLGAVFERWPVMQRILQVVGATYLLFLAWKIWRAGRVQLSDVEVSEEARPLTFWQAAAFQWVNPKAWTMAITALSAFALAPPMHIWSAAAVILMYFVVAFPCTSFWTLLGREVVKWLHSDRARQWFNSTLAALTVASVGLIFI